MALVTPSTCWKTPWTPQKHPPATIATSEVICCVAGSASAGAGIARATDGETRSATPAVSRSVAAMISVRRGPTLRLKRGLSSSCDIRRLRMRSRHVSMSFRRWLDEADNGVRNVQLLKRSNLIGGQFHVHGCESVVELLKLGGADDGRGNDRLCQQPGERHLRTRNAAR